jgi:hypothetical protein
MARSIDVGQDKCLPLRLSAHVVRPRLMRIISWQCAWVATRWMWVMASVYAVLVIVLSQQNMMADSEIKGSQGNEKALDKGSNS